MSPRVPKTYKTHYIYGKAYQPAGAEGPSWLDTMAAMLDQVLVKIRTQEA